jgi:transcriptional regulator of acetoin/glycerol metabolism
LENVMQQAALVCHGSVVLLRDLPDPITRRAATTRFSAEAPLDALKRNCEVIEQSLIRRVLEANGHNRTRTARELGVSRITLYKKMLKYGLIEGPVVRRPSAVPSDGSSPARMSDALPSPTLRPATL